MKVLIVDDDQAIVSIWSMSLKAEGLDVITAGTGREGIDLARSQKPDVILLDQIIPDMLGNDVLTNLKGDPETKAIPVILISNYNESQMMKDAIEKGAVDYVLKYQIETPDLVTKIKGLLEENKPQS
jgi:CheY-like chemotaxis protein